VLRVLGRATCFDGIEELALADEDTFRQFFHEFCERFCARYYNEFVHPPQNEVNIAKTMNIYKRMGMYYI
jgi:hypothetical protein